MKIHSFAITTALLLSAAGFSQTKKIAFESHSGKMENFSIALNNELFDNDESDYGLPSSKSKYKLDSVIYLTDSTSVLVSKEYKGPWEAKNDSQYKFVGARKDTIYNNPLFSLSNSTDSIRKGLKSLSGMISEYEASNKTVFVGFMKTKTKDHKEKVKEEEPKQQLIPFAVSNDPTDNSSAFDPRLVLMIGLILLLSLLGGLITWKLYKPQLATA